MIIEQIMVTHMAVFCYLIVDEATREAVIIDPGGETDKIMEAVTRHKAHVKYVINTHGHFDHTSGNNDIIAKTGAALLIHQADSGSVQSAISNVMSRMVLHEKGSARATQHVKDGELIEVGDLVFRVIHTPGHSRGSICLYVDGNIFTGDTLFTEGTGRTDLPGGSEKEIMHSIKNIILALPDATVIWPGHHYGRFTRSTVEEQKRYY